MAKTTKPNPRKPQRGKRRTGKTSADFDELVPDPVMQQRIFDHLRSGERLLADGSPFQEMLQQAVNRMLEAEVDHHLDTERLNGAATNKRNGYTNKRVTSEFGELDVRTPRDRQASFEPQLIAKRERALSSGIDEQIIALYAQGNSIEDTRRLVKKLYGVDISAGQISAITDAVWADIEAWRSRPLQPAYAVVYLDAVFFRVRSTEGATGPRGKGTSFSQRASYTVYAIDFDGNRDILGLYVMAAEGAMGWGRVLEDLRRRGVDEVFCFCIDGLKGLAPAIREVYATSIVQRCVVHQLRSTTRFCNDSDVKAVRRDLRAVYTAVDETAARQAMDRFAEAWDGKYPNISASWREQWDDLMAFLVFPEDLRRIIYTTNPVEAVHRILRKLIKGKAAWTSESALIKQLYLSLQHNEKSWRRRANHWRRIQSVFVNYAEGYWSKYLPDA